MSAKKTKKNRSWLTREELFLKSASEFGYKGEESIDQLSDFLIGSVGLCPVFSKEDGGYYLESWEGS